VSNIYKYYVTYLLIQGEYIERRGLKRTGSAVGTPQGPRSRLAIGGPPRHVVDISATIC
jgi:hypothetical protein